MDARELKDAATDHFRKGRFAKAAEAYAQLTKLDPKEPQHLIKLGDSYRRDGRKEQAVTAYRGAVDAYAKIGVMIKAIAACKLVLEIDPNQKDAQEALAQLCAKRYVRRIDGPIGPASFAPPRRAETKPSEPLESMDLPEESSSPLEIEGREPIKREPTAPPPGPPTKAPPSRGEARKPIPIAPPPRDPHAVEPIAFDDELDPVQPAAAAEKEPSGPDSIDLDLDEPAAPSAPSKAPAAVEEESDGISIDMEGPEDLALDVAAAAVDDQAEELPDADLIVEPETEEERELMRAATDAAKKPTTAMAGILAEASHHDDEIEVFAVSTADDEEVIDSGAVEADDGGIEVEAPDAEPEPAEAEAAPEEPAEAEAAPALEEYLGTAPEEEDAEPAGTPVTSPIAFAEPAVRDQTEVTDISAATLAPEVDQYNVPLFSELPRDAFVELLERIDFQRVSADDVIVKEGDVGKSIFILSSGKAKVVKGHGTRSAIDLAVLEEGAFFGEMALLNGSPRVASVIAMEDCDVLELKEGLLRELTTRHPSVGQSLKKFYRQRLLQNVMAISPLFKAFDKPDRKLLVEKFKVREVKTNEAIINEGQATDGLFVIMHGAALVQKRDAKNSRNVPLAVLKEGDVFGEMSLLTHRPATATVLAKRRTIVLRLPKPSFDELMFTHPTVLEVVSELSDQRSKVNEAILAGKADAPRDALAFL